MKRQRRLSTLERLFRFGAMGGVGFILNLAVTVTLHEGLGASEELAFAVALAAVFCFSFITGRYVIFAGAAGDPKRQLVKFAVSSAAFRGAEYLGFLILHTLLATPYLIAAVVTLGASFFVKFFFYGKVVFVEDA